MGEENLYSGAGSSLSPSYGVEEKYDSNDSFFGVDYRAPTSSFAITTDARSANQLSEISKKLNQGVQTIEMGVMDSHTLDSIPKQHLVEINRLRKLAGNVDLTMHGPIVEASGMGERGVSEDLRRKAEKQIFSTLDRAHDVNPEGNVVVTFHSTAQLPDLIAKRIETKNGKREEKLGDLVVVNESEGNVTIIKPEPNHLEGKEEVSAYDRLTEFNKERWLGQLSQASFRAHQGMEVIEKSSNVSDQLKERGIKLPKEFDDKTANNGLLELYRQSNTEEGQKFIDALSPEVRDSVTGAIRNLNYGEIYTKESYNELQSLFGKAWESLNKNPEKNKDEIKKLIGFRDEMKNVMDQYKKDSISNLPKFAEKVTQGIKVLSNLKDSPQSFRPMQDFVMEKSSETFSNAALNSYKKFKDKSPIISIENPPAGSGISRAEDLKKLIEESRKKLANKLVEAEGLEKEEAQKQAKKLIGATWDVGHINMMKQFGYGDSDVESETRTIAKYVNKIHLSDNFGLEHTELPMGMGNVPMQKHLNALKEAHGSEVGKIKKVIEAIDWYKNFQTSPFTKTLQSFGSPIYGMQMAPYWNQTPAINGGYFSGYGMMLPDQHFSTYGSGFSGLPQELGGQVAGRSRLSGNAME